MCKNNYSCSIFWKISVGNYHGGGCLSAHIFWSQLCLCFLPPWLPPPPLPFLLPHNIHPCHSTEEQRKTFSRKICLGIIYHLIQQEWEVGYIKADSLANYLWYYFMVLFIVPPNSTSNSAKTYSKRGRLCVQPLKLYVFPVSISTYSHVKTPFFSLDFVIFLRRIFFFMYANWYTTVYSFVQDYLL